MEHPEARRAIPAMLACTHGRRGGTESACAQEGRLGRAVQHRLAGREEEGTRRGVVSREKRARRGTPRGRRRDRRESVLSLRPARGGRRRAGGLAQAYRAGGEGDAERGRLREKRGAQAARRAEARGWCVEGRCKRQGGVAGRFRTGREEEGGLERREALERAARVATAAGAAGPGAQAQT
jgi:hypothetical protein